MTQLRLRCHLVSPYLLVRSVLWYISTWKHDKTLVLVSAVFVSSPVRLNSQRRFFFNLGNVPSSPMEHKSPYIIIAIVDSRCEPFMTSTCTSDGGARSAATQQCVDDKNMWRATCIVSGFARRVGRSPFVLLKEQLVTIAGLLASVLHCGACLG